MKPIWDRLTFSGLQRYVMICDCVFNSDEYLSSGDRAAIIQDLLDDTKPLTARDIAARCKQYADEHMDQDKRGAYHYERTVR